MTNREKVLYIMSEFYNVKRQDVDDRSALLAEALMDQVDSGERPELNSLFDVDKRIEAIALDYVAAFCEYPLTEDEWEDVFAHEHEQGFFGDDRQPVVTSILRGLENV